MTCVVCIQLVNTIFLTWHEHMRKSWESTTGKETLSKASDNTCQPTMCHTLFVSILFTLQIIYHQKTKACTAIQNTHSYKIINISILSGSAVLSNLGCSLCGRICLKCVSSHRKWGHPWGRYGVGEHLVALREQALFRMRSYAKY